MHMNYPVIYQCWLVDSSADLDRIWLWVQSHQGWMSSHPLGVLFWLPEDSVWFLLLLAASARPRRDLDYVD